jgi:putative two-component system protein, hydrogenase maturation factor HypX/HoxX
MRLLLLTHAFNGLTQRLYVELAARGHELSVEFDINDAVTREAVAVFRPAVVVAPFLKRAIPADVWRSVPCLIVHPGIVGDRGPSALDWAIREGEREWGVTVLQANAEFDGGDVWAAETFPLRVAAKSSVYRGEVTAAAVRAVLRALDGIAAGRAPAPVDPADPRVRGRARPLMRQAERAIDWAADGTATVLARIHAGDSFPGVRCEVLGLPVHLFGGWAEDTLHGGAPGEVIAQRQGAILRATRDGAVWITHLKEQSTEPRLKLPAAQVLGERLHGIPEAPLAIDAPASGRTWREIGYAERDGVGELRFEFHNGAMSTAQCRRLAEAIDFAAARPTRVLVLLGGREFWSNGIHLGVIEASSAAADESLRNIEAMNDACRAIITLDSKLVVAALRGNAAAGGVFLALGADEVVVREGTVLNPHYKNMGNLYGSEYWTYLLPRRVGQAGIARVMQNRLPIGASTAVELGLADAAIGGDPEEFEAKIREHAAKISQSADYPARVAAKRARRAADEAVKPLQSYRAEELRHLHRNFYGFDPSYHVARHHFVYRVPHSWTPRHLAAHRRLGFPGRGGAG